METSPELDGGPPAPRESQGGIARRLELLVRRAQAALLWEQAWPALWWPLGIILAFLTVSWLGVWLEAPPPLRFGLLAAFALALLASFWPLVRLRTPGRTASLDRLDRDAGLAHRPARSFSDQLALGETDPGSRALWALHRRRAEAAIGQLRVAPPRPDMPRRDRFALRGAAILAAIGSAFVAGPDIGSRIAAAFDGSAPAEAAPLFRIDGWIDPPLYTRLPPLMIDLAAGTQTLKAPIGSTLVVRVAGRGDASVTAEAGLSPLPAPEGERKDLKEQRFKLTGPADLGIRTGLANSMRLHVDAIPDRAPEIALSAPPDINVRGTFTLNYRAKDDYGLTAAEGLVEKAEGGSERRSLVAPPRIALTLPADPRGEGDASTVVDLTNHPWAGAKVRLTLVARDDIDQQGRSETVAMTLPQRPFTKPLAKALVEQRRNLVLDPDRRTPVQVALDALLIAPERYTPQWGVFMGLRSAAQRLRRARDDAELVEIADWLWAMALQIEDGDLSDAERELRAAQDRLRDAIERGADQNEIRQLTQDLRNALDKFMSELAQRMERDRKDGDQSAQASPDRTITPNDLNQMLNQVEEMMKRGEVAEAQRLLEQLRNILENLQTARPGSRMSDPMAREMNRSMEELDAMAREQRELRDETFRQGQEKRMQRGDRRRDGARPGQQGQRQPGQRGPRQPGQQGEQDGEEQAENGQNGQGNDPSGLGRRQQALRERLQQLQRRMRGMGMQGEQGLADAEREMSDAEAQLGQGQEGQAVDPQGRALEGLQRGMQGMAQQMQQMGQGDGSDPGDNPGGPGSPQGRAQNDPRNDDPLGRPTRGRDFSDGRVRVPTADESAVQRARRIMEELRRKLGDPTRPREELDYFERLLRRN